MKDFIKIFVFLLVVVIAFVFGRNYGERTIVESEEFKTNRDAQERLLKTEAELKLIKDKFQNLLDSSDLKKADDVFTKIMTMFLVDLGLRISEEKQNDLDVGKAALIKCTPELTNKNTSKMQTLSTEKQLTAKETNKEKKWSKTEIKKFKTKEWLLLNSNSESAIKNNLNFLNITNIDEYLRGASALSFAESEQYVGVYRGKIIDVSNKEYGSLIIEIKPDAVQQNQIIGSIKVFRQGNVEVSNSFKSTTFGLKPNDYSGVVINANDRFFQIYKINNLEKMAGFFYERLPNGTSKTIGSFILSRTDRF